MFCPTCVDGGEEEKNGNNFYHVHLLRIVQLVPSERSLAWVLGEAFEIQTLTTSNGDSLANNVEHGENFAIVGLDDYGLESFI